MSQPAVRAALVTGAARQWQHGRFWVNDPDCLIVRPEVEGREEWAAHVESTGGLVASSDNLRLLDDWGSRRRGACSQTARPAPTLPPSAPCSSRPSAGPCAIGHPLCRCSTARAGRVLRRAQPRASAGRAGAQDSSRHPVLLGVGRTRPNSTVTAAPGV
jgi:hypothetical protein